MKLLLALLRPVPIAATWAGISLALAANMLTNLFSTADQSSGTLVAALLFLVSSALQMYVHAVIGNKYEAALATARDGGSVVDANSIFENEVRPRVARLVGLVCVSTVLFFLGALAPTRFQDLFSFLSRLHT